MGRETGEVEGGEMGMEQDGRKRQGEETKRSGRQYQLYYYTTLSPGNAISMWW